MRRMPCAALTIYILNNFCLICAIAQPLLIPVGKTVGLKLQDHTVSIAAFDDVLEESARHADLKIGDQILAVNGKPVHNSDEIRKMLNTSGGEAVLSVRRGGKELEIHVNTTQTETGPRLSVYLKQGITGIGTVTWYDPATGQFGALGHGVNDSGGVLMQMAEGSTFPAEVGAVSKGKCGHPGHASIRSTVQGDTARDYSTEILKVYSADRFDGRNLLLRITDPELLETTGGVVQGMSGSPILQDGRLIGAVTHVLVQNPTMGYGIFIRNMLDAAG